MTMMDVPLLPPLPHEVQGADPVDVSLKHWPQPEPHQVDEPPKMPGDAAAVYTPEEMPFCQEKGELLPVPQPQAPIWPS
jgi:hypothetical protein